MQIGLESAIRVWVEEFSKISKAMTRYKVFAAIDPQWAAKYAASVKAGDATKINEFKEKERTRYLTEDINSIDPVTMYDIVEGVIWPTISKYDSALVDHPDPLLNSMRGVTINQVFKGKVFRTDGSGIIHKLSPDIPFAKNAHNALQVVVDIVRNGSGLDEGDRKRVLSLMFSPIDAAALYYISYGRMSVLGHPIQTMATLNPYLGYFLMTIAWLGGNGAIAKRDIDTAIITGKDGNGIAFPEGLPQSQNDAIAAAAVTGGFVSLNATIAAISANHKWLQQQKTNPSTKDFFKGWSDRFINNPDSIVSMVVILNEIVNINSKLTYRYSPKAKKRLTELGAAYVAGFTITVGD